MAQQRRPSKNKGYTHTATGASKQLMIQRLREIDDLTEKELAQLKSDTDKLKRILNSKHGGPVLLALLVVEYLVLV